MSDEWEELINTPDRRFGNETPVAGRYWLLEKAQAPLPETDIQALMEAAPGDEPRTSREHLAELNERIVWIVENDLSDEEKAVVEIMVFAGHSTRFAAQMLGWPKSTVHRLKLSALERIRKLLEMEGTE